MASSTNTSDDSLFEDIKEEARNVLRSWIFDVVIGTIIALNAVSISVEQTLEINGRDTSTIRVIESVFLSIYIIELGLRFLAFGKECLTEFWVKLDVVLVALGIIQCWIVEFLVDGDSSFLGPVMLLRSARLLRLCKTIKMLAQVQEFWMLIRGLLNSASIMLYTFAILFLVLFIFSSVAIELITKSSYANEDTEFGRVVEQHFDTVPNTMLTLLQFACMDRIAEIYRPLIKQDGWLSIYFIILIIVCMVLASLIGAVIFSRTIAENDAEHELAKKVQETKWSELFGDMKGMFARLDTDKTGILSRENVVNMGDEDQIALSDALGVTEKADIFRMLDREKKGYITINEFVDRILETTTSQGSVGLTRMERQVESMHWRTKEIFSAQYDLHYLLRKVVVMIEGLQPSLDNIQSQHVQAKEAMTRISGAGQSIFALAEVSNRKSLTPALLSSPEARKSTSFAERVADLQKTVDCNGYDPDPLGMLNIKEKVQSTTPDWAVGILDSLTNIWQEHVQDIMNQTRGHLEMVAKGRTKKPKSPLSPDCKALPREINAKRKIPSRGVSPGSDCPSVTSGDSVFSELIRAAKHGPIGTSPASPLKGAVISRELTTELSSNVLDDLGPRTLTIMSQDGLVKI